MSLNFIVILVTELIKEIRHFQSHVNVTADVKQGIGGKLGELSSAIEQFQDANKRFWELKGSLGKIEDSSFVIFHKRRIDSLREQITNTEKISNASKKLMLEIAQWFKDNCGVFNVDIDYTINNNQLSEQLVRGIESRTEHCVVGLNEQLQPLIDEFTRLQNAYRDIYEQYSSLFDGELHDYQSRHGREIGPFHHTPSRMKRSGSVDYRV